MSGRGSPEDYRNQQPHGALGHHHLDSNQLFDDHESVIPSPVHDRPERKRRTSLTRYDYLDHTGGSAGLIRTQGGWDAGPSIRQSRDSRNAFDSLPSLPDRVSNSQLAVANPLSSQSPVTSLEDDREDGGSIDTDDEAGENGQTWIEEDPITAINASSGAQSRSARRFRLTHAQTRFLVNEFSRQQHPDAAQRERLSKEIPGLSPRQVQVWFQNRRAKMKRLNLEDQERMMRARSLQSSALTGTSVYPPLNVPLQGSTSLTSPAGLSSMYAQATSFAGLSTHEHSHEAGGRFYGGQMPGPSSVEDPFNIPVPPVRTFSTRAPSDQSVHSYSPTTLSQFGTSWQVSYPITGGNQQNFAAYPSLSNTGTSPSLNASLYGGSSMAAPMGASPSNPGYGSSLPYAGSGSFAFLDQISPPPQPGGSLSTTNPQEGSHYGTTVGYSTAPSLPLDLQTLGRRHDSINEGTEPSSAGYPTYPENFTSTHMPHYHGYNG